MIIHHMGIKLVSLFLLSALAGVVLGNPVILKTLVLSFVFICLGLVISSPRPVEVRRQILPGACYVGKTAAVEVEVELKGGMGPVVVADVLPESFLLEEGSNLLLVWKGMLPQKINLQYRVRFTRSGKYYLDEVAWSSCSAAGWYPETPGKLSAPATLEVRPRLVSFGRLRNVASPVKRPLPTGASAVYGVSTLDFRELRPYRYGDPCKFINWKATARTVGGGGYYPVVNEFEKEGKKTAWVYLEHSGAMNFGTSMEDSWEYALEAVHNLATYYLKENMRVGFCTFGKSSYFLYPASGNRQYRRILQLIFQLKELDRREGESVYEGSSAEDLQKKAVKYRKYYQGEDTLHLVVTRARVQEAPQLWEGIRQLGRYARPGRQGLPVIIVNIGGYGLAARTQADKIAGSILKTRDRFHLESIRQRVAWLDWDPSEKSFSSVLKKLEVR